MERVIGYVDGFNLYFGLKSKGWKKFYWLDIQKLLMNILIRNQQLIMCKYFTAEILGPEAKRERQQTYLSALKTLKDFEVIPGRYLKTTRRCPYCSREFQQPSEKMSDVSLAVELVADAFQNKFDTAIIVSGDGDLTPPICTVKSLFPEKRIVVAFPPERKSHDLKEVTDAWFMIGHRKFEDSLFSIKVTSSDGTPLECPPSWA